MIEEIKKNLLKAAKGLGIEDPIIKLEHPENPENGDFSSNLAMMYAKNLKMPPKALAEKIVQEFKKVFPESVEKVEIAGPGFINIYLKKEAITEHTKSILKNKKDFGKSKTGKGKKIIVEYSSPNIAKPFTVGHLRSTVIGDAIANIHEYLGYEVIRDNHLGDWGTQFGKLLFAIEKWGDWKKIEESAEPIKELVGLYVKFHDEAEKDNTLEDEARKIFKKLELREDKEIINKWQKCIDLSMKEFEKIYGTLDIKFDTYYGESKFATPEKTKEVIELLNKKNLLVESEGAQVVKFENEKYPPLIIQKTDGTTIYATRDLATDLFRKKEYGENLTIVNEVGSEQTLYFRQLYEIEKMLGWFKDGERVHVAHGLYRFKDGKMSTRKGNVIWLQDIIDEAIKHAAAINKESAKEVAVGAIKFNDLKRDSIHDIVFDWDEIMNMTGDSGPYLQYSAVRANTVLQKAKEKGIKPDIKSQRPEIKSLDLLERYMIYFEDIVSFAGNSYKPNILASYLINLASLFNAFYAQSVILDEKDESSSYKLAVTEAFMQVMKNGLSLLGIKVPERM